MAHMNKNYIPNTLSKSIDLFWNSCESLSSSEYMKLYSEIFTYLTTGWVALNRSPGRRANQPNDTSGILVERLYVFTKNYIRNKLDEVSKDINSQPAESILQYYKRSRDEHRMLFRTLNGAYNYFNRYCDRGKYRIGTDVCEIHVLCTKIWSEVVLKPFFPRIIEHLTTFMSSYHENRTFTDTNLIQHRQKLSFSGIEWSQYPSIGFDFLSTNINSTDISDIHYLMVMVEEELLRTTKDFYQEKPIPPSFESNGQLFNYIKSIVEYVDYEIQQANVCLLIEISSLKKLQNLLEEIFFPPNIVNIIVDKLRILLLDDNNYNELSIQFESICRLKIMKNELLKLIEEHVYERGIHEIKAAFTNKAMNETIDPSSYIETLVNLQTKYQTLIQDIFANDAACIAARNKGYAKFVNENIIIEDSGMMAKSEVLLCQYCDLLLKKGKAAIIDDDWDHKQKNILIVFDFIESKDLFMRIYQKKLCKRLLNESSVSHEYETSLISAFKDKCGHEYTSKFEQMMKDIRISEDLTKEYKENVEKNSIYDSEKFSVMVFMTNYWPLSSSPDVILPIELKSMFDDFTKFYLGKYNGRKLMLLHQHSYGELRMKISGKDYQLLVSTYQIMILLLFNEKPNWTVKQIQDQTKIESELLTGILSILSNKNILISENGFDSTSVIRLTDNFTSDKFRVNLNIPLKLNKEKKCNDLSRTIDEERPMKIQAALVRIMKKEKILKYSLLIEQIRTQFQPEVLSIKKCIEILIEKEYFQRDPNDKNTLVYLP
ncbi:unnamed protein product [Adineta ricciae]|uniref:Cullin family profile domain-containing protein n=1 Tax=Adineta ricciae TaxID=249248 RepID=A0A815K6C6_ADIRI|nr:unnamed protein product [Adineta ricciae]